MISLLFSLMFLMLMAACSSCEAIKTRSLSSAAMSPRGPVLPPPIPLVRQKMWEAKVSLGTPPQEIRIEMDSGWGQLVVSTIQTPPPYPYPNSPYEWQHSATAQILTCDVAKVEGVQCDSCDGPMQICSTLNYSIFDGPVYQWGCDILRIDGMDELQYCFAMTNQTGFTGDFGFKIPVSYTDMTLKPGANPSNGAPYTDELLQVLHDTGVIPRLMFSACVNDSSRTGALQLGGLLSIDDAMLDVHLAGPYEWMSHNVSAAWIGNFLIFNRSASATMAVGPVIAGVDTGTITLRLPIEWVSTIVDHLSENCSTSPLAGVCSSPEFPLVNNTTIFAGTVCYRLTEDQIAAFPALAFQVDDLDPSQPPHLVVHPASAYLFHSSLFALVPGLVNCDATDAVLADFGFMPLDPGSSNVILGETFYRHRAFATDYTEGHHAQAFAPLQQCGGGEFITERERITNQ